jgi:hypothetical protein
MSDVSANRRIASIDESKEVQTTETPRTHSEGDRDWTAHGSMN